MLPQERKRVLAAIFACAAVYGITFGLSNPLLSLILESRGVSRTLIGLNAAMPAFGLLLGSLMMPTLIRFFGIKHFLLLCLVVDLCMFLMFPLLDHLYAWFVIRFISGIAVNGLFIASEIWINEITLDENRGRILGIYNTFLAASVSLGPLIIPMVGIDGWAPFIVAAILVALAAIPIGWTGSSSPVMHGDSSFSITSFIFIAPTLIFAVLLFSWKEYAGTTFLPVYAVRSGIDDNIAAIMLTILGVGGICLTYPIGWLADKVDRYLVLILCGICAGLGALFLPIVITNGAALWILLFFWGGSFAGLYTVTLTIIGQRFRGMDLTIANVALGVVWGIGSLTGPTVTGIAMDIWDPQGFPGVFVIFSVLFVLFVSIRWSLLKNKTDNI